LPLKFPAAGDAEFIHAWDSAYDDLSKTRAPLT